MLVGVEPRAARRDAAVGAHGRGLGEHESRAADGEPAEVDHVPVVGRAVHGRVLAHGGHDDAVGERPAAELERREERLGGAPARGHGQRASLPEVLAGRVDEGRVPQGQVLPGDALGARHQAEHERLGREARVAVHVLEPLEARLGGLLDLEHVDAARVLVGGQGRRDALGPVLLQGVHEGDGALHGELGARADREVRGVDRVAQQDHVAVVPALAAHRGEGAPHGAVGQERVPVEELGEQLLHARRGLLLGAVLEAGAAPGVLVALDDPGGELLLPALERVGVHREHAVLGLLEDEGEGVERLGRAEPGELRAAPVEAGLEVVGEAPADRAVDAVGGDDEVGLGQVLGIDLGLEGQLDPDLLAAALQDLEQEPARHAAEAVPGGADPAALVPGVDVRPVREGLADRGVALGVGVLERAQGLVGEHHAPPEGVVGPVALGDPHRGAGEALLGQEGRVEPPGAASDALDPHGRSISGVWAALEA